MTPEEILRLLAQPERADLEFKDRMTRDLLRVVVAMANGQGGTIIVGVSDRPPRRILGVTGSFDELEGQILNGLRDRVKPLLHPLPELERVQVGDKDVLVVQVSPGQVRGLTVNGHRLVRRGSHTNQMTREEERRMFQESHEVSFERSLVPDARFEHLDLRKVQAYLDARLARLTEQDQRSPAEWLVSFGLVREGDYAPTVAALVLFGDYPPRFLPQVAVNAIRFRGRDVSTNLLLDRELIEGTAAEMIERTVLFVQRNMRVGGVIGGIYREDIPEYPDTAVREAVINAVIHRDYQTQQKVLLRMFDDRLEIENPGGLPAGLTLDMLLQNPRPYPRNPLIVRSLLEFWRGRGLIEEAGSGIPRIFRALRELGSGEPSFWADALSFRVTMPARIMAPPEKH